MKNIPIWETGRVAALYPYAIVFSRLFHSTPVQGNPAGRVGYPHLFKKDTVTPLLYSPCFNPSNRTVTMHVPVFRRSFTDYQPKNLPVVASMIKPIVRLMPMLIAMSNSWSLARFALLGLIFGLNAKMNIMIMLQMGMSISTR